jgi:hypothetical protein
MMIIAIVPCHLTMVLRQGGAKAFNMKQRRKRAPASIKLVSRPLHFARLVRGKIVWCACMLTRSR